MIGDRHPLGCPESHVEEGIDLHGQTDAEGQLVGVVHGEVAPDQIVRNGVALVGPRQGTTVAASALSGAPGLRPADEHTVGPPGQDVLGRPVHQGLGRLAAARRVDRAGVRPEPLGQDASGVAVAPRQDADDADRVEGCQDALRTRVDLGPAGRFLEQGDGFEGVGPVVDTVGELADTDEHRGPRVQGHERKLDGGVVSVESGHRRPDPLHGQHLPLADGRGAPRRRAGPSGRGRHGPLGRTARGRPTRQPPLDQPHGRPRPRHLHPRQPGRDRGDARAGRPDHRDGAAPRPRGRDPRPRQLVAGVHPRASWPDGPSMRVPARRRSRWPTG